MTAAALLLLAGCGPGSILGPDTSWVESVLAPNDRGIAVTFSGDEILDLLFQDTEGVLRVGQLDAGDAGRSVVVKGEAFAPELDQVLAEIEPSVAWFDLDHRPAGAELWVYAAGLVGRFEQDGTMQVLWDGREGLPRRGALSFGDDRFTLHVGLEGLGYRVLTLDVDGFVTSVDEPDVQWTNGAGEVQTRPMPAPCQVEARGTTLYVSLCDPGAAQVAVGVLDGGVYGPTHQGDGPAAPPVGAIAVEDDRALLMEGRTYCLATLQGLGTSSKGCEAARYVGPWSDRGAVSPGGARLALLHDQGPVLLVEEVRPQEATEDLQGVWCRLEGNLDMDRLTLFDDGSLSVSLAPTAGGAEADFGGISWSSGPGRLVIEFVDGANGDERVSYPARRVADTLYVEPPEEIGEGLTSAEGLWMRQGGPQCDYGHTMLPAR